MNFKTWITRSIFCSALLALSPLTLAQGSFTQLSHDELIKKGSLIAARGNDEGTLACVTCHGSGQPRKSPADYSQIAGFSRDYMLKQIRDFQSSTRESDAMHLNATSLVSQDELMAVLTFYSSLPRPNIPTTVTPPDPSNPADWLAKRGDWSRGIPACYACHGPNGYGVGSEFPPLAGQDKQYIEKQLKNFKSGMRYNDPQGMMGNVAFRLSDEEIEALATYFYALPSQLQAQAQQQSQQTRTRP